MTRRSRVRVNHERLDRLERDLAELGRVRVKVGVLANSEASNVGFALPELAAVHEFGSRNGHVPERSFIRRTLHEKRALIEEQSARIANGVLAGKVKPRQALEALGQVASTEIRKTITSGPPLPPPLAPTTVAKRTPKGKRRRRGRAHGPVLARPLVDTGRLVQSISYAVEDSGA